MCDDIHEVYAIRYGHHPRPARDNYIGGDPHDVMQPLDYFVWAIVGAAGTFIVDTGFDKPVGDRRGRQIVTPVPEGLAALGISPDAVKDVIVSPHAFRSLRQPPRCFRMRAIICRIARWNTPPAAACATRNCATPMKKSTSSRWCARCSPDASVFHDGEGEIAPGITVHHIGGHAKGLQCVRVKTRRGHVVLASDATHLYEHMDSGRIFPTTYNLAEVLEGYNTLRRLASSPQHVVPGHDPEVTKRYPAAKAGLEGWVVRLDAEPTQ